jgi:MFS family permease
MEASRPHPLTSLYVAGPFSMGYVDFYTFLIPLYGLSLGLDASEIGILVGARSIVAMFLSIHIGALMDRIGTRSPYSSFGRQWRWRRCFRWCRGFGRCCCCNW